MKEKQKYQQIIIVNGTPTEQPQTHSKYASNLRHSLKNSAAMMHQLIDKVVISRY